MNENEEKVIEVGSEEITENTVGQTVEENVEGIELTDTTETEEVEETKEVEQVRTYTDEDLDKIIAKKLAIQERKLTKDFESKMSTYKNTESVLNAGLGTKDIDEATQRLTEYYKEQGINIPEPTKPGLSEREQEILARAEAEEIIELGKIEAEREANLLASRYDNLNVREKAVFNTLANYLTVENQKAELQKIGVKPDILEDKDFKKFKQKFSPKANITEVYNLYSKTKGEKETPKPIGSMTTTETNKVKDYYTPEEARRLTEKDLDDPQVMKAVEYSMTKWEQDKH